MFLLFALPVFEAAYGTSLGALPGLRGPPGFGLARHALPSLPHPHLLAALCSYDPDGL